MSAPSLVFEVLLREVRFSATALRAQSGRHLLSAALAWPRPLIAQRNAVQEINIRSGRCDRSADGWHARVLFKERVQGRFALVLSLSEALSDAGLDSLVRAMAAQVLKRSSGDLTSWASDSLLAGLWAAPFAALARDVTGKREPAVMGWGALDLASTELRKDRVESISVPLRAPRRLERTLTRAAGEHARDIRGARVEQDEQFGEVLLEIMPAW